MLAFETVPEVVKLDDSITLHRSDPTDEVAQMMLDITARGFWDPAFDNEPGMRGTLNSYVNLNRDEARERLHRIYVGEERPQIGYIACVSGEATGMIILAHHTDMAWRDVDGSTHTLVQGRGIAFSQYHVAKGRNQGVGSAIAKWRLGLIDELTASGGTWEGSVSWTSIRKNNHASRTVVDRLGRYTIAGDDTKFEAEAPEKHRDIWVDSVVADEQLLHATL